MVGVLTLAIQALVSSKQLPVFVLMAPRYLKEFTYSINFNRHIFVFVSYQHQFWFFVHSILVVFSP